MDKHKFTAEQTKNVNEITLANVHKPSKRKQKRKTTTGVCATNTASTLYMIYVDIKCCRMNVTLK